MQQPRIFFAVALHEKYALPTDALYTPIQAGAAIHPPLGLMRDDTGENISAKNGSYCELTVLYWMAHNVDADWYGLCHYRRYFSLRRTGCPQKRILTRAQLLPLLDTADIFFAEKAALLAGNELHAVCPCAPRGGFAEGAGGACAAASGAGACV